MSRASNRRARDGARVADEAENQTDGDAQQGRAAKGVCPVGFGQRFRRSVLGRADGPDHFSTEHPKAFPIITWSPGVSLATSIAYKGARAGAKAMAASAVDLFGDPKLVRRAKETFKEEIGDTVYRPLLPPDQKPPLELNRGLMKRYRPALREHYLSDRPVFD